MKTIFIAIQEYESRSWSPVARVDKLSNAYCLRYTKGALTVPGFEGFGRMRGLSKTFFSTELFPLLKNRILPRNRPEFEAYASWLGLSPGNIDAFEELSRTGGLRGTDSIELIPMPEPDANGRYTVYFFVHGIRHLSAEVAEIAKKLSRGARLYLAKDVQNGYDGHALLMRTDAPVSVIGYVPRYYSQEFSCLLDAKASDVQVTVERVNAEAPAPFRVLCKLDAPWPTGFAACTAESYQPIDSASDGSLELAREAGAAPGVESSAGFL